MIIGFFAGAIAANGIPHFVKGITGQKHMTPFGNPSSASANVVWGWLNFVIAGYLWSIISLKDYGTAFGGVALGALITGAILAKYWGEGRKKP